MADQIQLQIILSAQVDRVLAGLSSVEKGLAQMQQTQEKAATSSAQHQAKFEAFTKSVERAAKVFAGVWVLWQAAKDVFAGFEGLEQFNLHLQNMTQLLQGNATAASTWMQIAELMNVDVTQIERSFVALSRQMNDHSSPALKQMGISAVDARGHLKAVNQVLLESADYFHRHQGASNNAALAQQLFGRSGAELLPILEQGRAGIDTITETARKYGLVLTADAIQRNAQFTEELKVSEMAMRGFGITLGNAALPGIAALSSGLNNLIQQNLPAFEAAIARAVGYVLGFVQSLTGMSFTIDDGAQVLGSLSASTANLGTQQEAASAGANALARAEQRVRDQAQAAGAAIDRQITALQKMQDAQRFAAEQERLQQQVADKNDDILKLEHEAFVDYWLGNFAAYQNVQDQIAKAQEDQGNLQKQLSQGVADQQTKLKVDALEAQKKKIQDSADGEIKQMERAAKAGGVALGAMSSDFSKKFQSDSTKSADAFKNIMTSAAAKTGGEMGQKLADALWGSTTIVRRDNGSIERIIKNPGGDWQKIGNAIGEAIGTGISTSLGKAWDKFWLDTLNRTSSAFKAPSGGFNQRGARTSAAGGVFTQPTLTWVADGGIPEAVVPLGPGNQAPGASALPSNRDVVSALQALIRIQTAMLAAMAKSGGPGAQAALFNAVDEAKRWRALGVVGV